MCIIKDVKKNVSIREITKEDTSNIIKWRNSQHVMDVFIERTPLTEEKHLDWYENMVKTGKVVQFIMVDNVNNVDFGSAYLKNIDNINHKAEYGIFIGEDDYLSQGYGNRITSLVLDYAFNTLNLHKVYARILKYNKQSYNMFHKLGFKEDALFREEVFIEGEPKDVYFVSIIKEEWENVNKEK